MIDLQAPIAPEKIQSLRVGDLVELTGIIFTARDAVHKWLYDGNTSPFDLTNGVIYHCGPVTLKKGKKWIVTAAGPTTSMREEPYMATLIEKLKLRAVIGKGGMGEKTRQACQKFGCVYLHAVGGAAQFLAEAIESVEDVYGIEEFGSPEAIWKLKVVKFPAVVTIDAQGRSLHKEIDASSGEILHTLAGSGKK